MNNDLYFRPRLRIFLNLSEVDYLFHYIYSLDLSRIALFHFLWILVSLFDKGDQKFKLLRLSTIMINCIQCDNCFMLHSVWHITWYILPFSLFILHCHYTLSVETWVGDKIMKEKKFQNSSIREFKFHIFRFINILHRTAGELMWSSTIYILIFWIYRYLHINNIWYIIATIILFQQYI